MKKALIKTSYSLDKNVINYSKTFNKYEKQIITTIKRNVIHGLNSEYVKNQLGLFSIESYHSYFTLNGSLRISSMDTLGSTRTFFDREDRFFIRKFQYKTEYILRGPRYVAALDEHLSVPQKLKIYYEDINDGFQTLKDVYETNEFLPFPQATPVLDYIKNALITLYNAYTHRERLGQSEHTNQEYQFLKHKLLDAVNESVLSFYLSLVNQFSQSKFRDLLLSLDDQMLRNILEIITKEFQEFKFSSRALVRSEASHPLLLALFAYNIYTKYPNVKFVFGLPAGGTELACLVHKYLEFMTSYSNTLILLPLSFHSAKKDFNFRKNRIDRKYLKQFHKTQLNNSLVNSLLVDDNSSTGQTIELAQNLIRKSNDSINLLCAVAEADFIRSRLKADDIKKRHKVANPLLYKESVGVLPISKMIRRKYDLKEVIESRLLYSHYLNKNGTGTLIEKIKNEVIADSIENKYEFMIDKLNLNNAIFTFKHQFLSNFYSVKIDFQGIEYPSVEHAYLSQKFKELELQNLSFNQRQELNQIFKFKGLSKELVDFSNIFHDSTLAAGTVKRISNKLKEFGFQRVDWDDNRMNIMIELLLLKYADYEMLQLLIATGNRYLVEGNDWNDTFWGVTNDRGKNFLGRIIMNIRKKYFLEIEGSVG